MKTLRNLLKAQHPELSEALERSWKIAMEQWLPAISPSSSSFNSYPHLRNIEAYLDDVVTAFTPRSVGASECFLNPLEIYVLLASVLFHDIGRVREATAIKPLKHAVFSRQTIVGSFAQLGIPSRELAGVIGDIALQHDPPDGTPDNLPETAISPYGRLRRQPLAALLVLADHMDDAYSRTLPVYLHAAPEVEIKGAFRREVLAVQTDPKSHLVLTVLSHEFPTLPDGALTWMEPSYDPKGLDPEGLRESPPLPPKYREKSPALISRIYRGLSDVLDGKQQLDKSIDKNGAIADAGFSRSKATDDLSDRNRLVSDQKFIVNRTKAEIRIWPPGVLLALVLNDLKNNRDALLFKKADLAAIGVNLADWLVEYQGHLYDAEGHETIEPVLSREYLVEVTKAMWRLTVGVFAQGLFTYEELAAEVGDYDLQRLKLAARRLAILTENLGVIKDSMKNYSALQVLDDRWRWNYRKGKNGEETCYVKQEEILMALSRQHNK